MQPAIQPHIERFFAEHETPQHASTTTVRDALGPINQLTADIQKQVIEYRLQISAIERSSPPASIVGELDRLHQTLGALQHETQAILHAARRFDLLHAQFDRYMTEIKDSVAKAAEPPSASASESPAPDPAAQGPNKIERLSATERAELVRLQSLENALVQGHAQLAADRAALAPKAEEPAA